jgi:L-ascorbate metabolism protein UlaG (beta-lactamase superfamily)
MRSHRWFAATWLTAGFLVAGVHGYSQSVNFEQEAACHTLQPASTGGPLPKSPDVLVLRYFSYGNYEVAYRGKVLLFDAFYDDSRSPIAQPTGLKAADITHADAIFVGHTHLDHFQDAPEIAKRTGAPVFLGPPGLKYVQSQGLPASQTKIVRGGETIKQQGYTIQTALGIHMASIPKNSAAYADLVATNTTATEEQKKQEAEWKNDVMKTVTQSEDPLDPERDTMYHGTIIYVITFDDGFRLVYSDTAGVLSGGERALADSIHAGGGKVDLAILGYLDGGFNVNTAIRTAVTKVKVWDPSIFLPSHHHDGDLLYSWPMPEMPTAPLFEAFREQAPKTRGIEPLYRSPICVNTKTDEFFVGNYVR